MDLNKTIIKTIKQHHYDLLYSVYLKYGTLGDFTFQDLLNNFNFKQIDIYKNQKCKHKGTINIKKKITIPNNNNRCIARCWGSGSYKVTRDANTNIWSMGSYISYDPSSNQWTYGTRCKRKTNNSSFCSLHIKQLDKMDSKLTHGRFDSDPPHQHYDKYRRKLLMNISLYNQNN